MRLTLAAPLLLPLVAACTTIPQPSAPRPPLRPDVETQAPPPARPAPPPVTSARTPEVLRAPGLEGVIERDAAEVQRLFGTPRLDVFEGDMRKLQFSGEACVLDVFLYPLRSGAEPVATHVDARRASDGREVDRAACVAALRRP
jgi:hypothetical protein